jgi:hypothetical protein
MHNSQDRPENQPVPFYFFTVHCFSYYYTNYILKLCFCIALFEMNGKYRTLQYVGCHTHEVTEMPILQAQNKNKFLWHLYDILCEIMGHTLVPIVKFFELLRTYQRLGAHTCLRFSGLSAKCWDNQLGYQWLQRIINITSYVCCFH